jgi:hypothetical protein
MYRKDKNEKIFEGFVNNGDGDCNLCKAPDESTDNRQMYYSTSNFPKGSFCKKNRILIITVIIILMILLWRIWCHIKKTR